MLGFLNRRNMLHKLKTKQVGLEARNVQSAFLRVDSQEVIHATFDPEKIRRDFPLEAPPTGETIQHVNHSKPVMVLSYSNRL